MLEEKKQKTNIGLVLLYLYVNYTFYAKSIPIYVQYVFFYGIMALYIVLKHNILIDLVKGLGKHRIRLFITMGILGYLFALSFLVPVFYGTYDFSYVRVFLRIFANSIGIVFLLFATHIHSKEECLTSAFFKYFSIATSLYVLSTIIMAVFPGFKQFWLSIIYQHASNEQFMYNITYDTRYGLMGFSGFWQTYYCTTSCIMSLSLIIDQIYCKQKKSLLFFITLVFSIVGNAFYGRVGLLCSIACILLACFYILFKLGKLKLLVFHSCLLVLLYVFAGRVRYLNDTFNRWYEWAMEPFITYASDGSLGTVSSNYMISMMYFMPKMKTFFFGDGYFTDPYTGAYYMRTDVGFIRPILFYGVFAQALGYLIPIVLLIGASRLIKHTKSNYFLSVCCFLMFFQMVFFEFKGTVLVLTVAFALGIFLSAYIPEKEASKA